MPKDSLARKWAAGAKRATLTTLRKQRPIVGFVGDSRVAQGIQVGTANGGVTNRKKPAGANAWLEFLSNGAVQCPSAYNVAVSSSLVSALPGQVASLLAMNPRPDIVVVLSGTNSFGAAVSASSAWTDYAAALAMLAGATIPAVCIADLPRQVSTWTAGFGRQSRQFNRAFLASGVASYGAYFIDPAYLIADPANANGDPLTNYTYDGIHPATLGAHAIGRELWTVIQGIIPPSGPSIGTRADAYHATDNPYGNILEAATAGSSLFQGTAGTNTTGGGAASGTVASGWNNRTLTGTGTSTASIVARSDGKPGNLQQIVLTASDVSTYRFSFITNPPASSYFAAGDRLQLAMDMIVTGATGLEQLELYLSDYNGTVERGSSRWSDDTLIGATRYPMPTAFSGRAITDPLTIIASPNSAIVRVNARVNAGSATIQLGAAELRRV